MNILSIKPGHDGAIAYTDGSSLEFVLEAEKDSFPRFSGVSAQLVVEAMERVPAFPDVVAIGGWHKHVPGFNSDIAAGYAGLHPGHSRAGTILGRPVTIFSSTHERSHIYMTAGLSPGAPHDECIVLVWEGTFGSFYHWQDYGRTITPFPVMTDPGAKYSSIFAIADPGFNERARYPRPEDAGKIMALAAFAAPSDCAPEDQELVTDLLRAERVYPFEKSKFARHPLYNCGVTSPRFTAAASYMSDRIFRTFHAAACRIVGAADLPLLISGGCGLNCDWNEAWRRSGLFASVFVPPCTNDSGSAVGTALDALASSGEECRLDWSVYAGAALVEDVAPDPNVWRRVQLDVGRVAEELAAGQVVPWVQGRCEFGPRALGNRSLLASPLAAASRDRLNRIKGREAYRPIAPCCREEELDRWFDMTEPDPHMLYLAQVRTKELPAVTHVDGSARVQSVSPIANPPLHQLLTAFGERSGFGVLCNTSLNFGGTGFINRLSDVIHFCDQNEIDIYVCGTDLYRRY